MWGKKAGAVRGEGTRRSLKTDANWHFMACLLKQQQQQQHGWLCKTVKKYDRAVSVSTGRVWSYEGLNSTTGGKKFKKQYLQKQCSTTSLSREGDDKSMTINKQQIGKKKKQNIHCNRLHSLRHTDHRPLTIKKSSPFFYTTRFLREHKSHPNKLWNFHYEITHLIPETICLWKFYTDQKKQNKKSVYFIFHRYLYQSSLPTQRLWYFSKYFPYWVTVCTEQSEPSSKQNDREA